MTETKPRICKLDFSNRRNNPDLENKEQYFKCEFEATQYGGYTIDYIAEDHFGIKQITINNCYGDGILAKVCYDENVYNLDIHQYIANKVSDALHPWLDYKHAISLDFEDGLTIFQQEHIRSFKWLFRYANQWGSSASYCILKGRQLVEVPRNFSDCDISAFKPIEMNNYRYLSHVKTYEASLI
jgi:hypothetical protein